ncbi:MAG: hypothetical protein WBB91_11040, partial [Nostocoides sp.]
MKVSTQRLDCDHFGGLGVDQEAGSGWGAQGRIAQQLGISRTTVIKAVKSQAPPRYERTPGPTSFTVIEPAMRALLERCRT